jgi:hypothetical protein
MPIPLSSDQKTLGAFLCPLNDLMFKTSIDAKLRSYHTMNFSRLEALYATFLSHIYRRMELSFAN